MSNDPNQPRRPSPPPLRVPASVQFGERAAAAAPLGGMAPPAAPVQPARRQSKPNTFVPTEPRSWEESGVDPEFALNLVLRTLMGQASVAGKQISGNIGLPLPLVNDVMNELKTRKLITLLGTNAAHIGAD